MWCAGEPKIVEVFKSTRISPYSFDHSREDDEDIWKQAVWAAFNDQRQSPLLEITTEIWRRRALRERFHLVYALGIARPQVPRANHGQVAVG